MKWGWLPLAPLFTQRFDSLAKVGRLRMPVIVAHGSDDGLVPAAFGRTLYERALTPKRFVLVEGGSHYSTNALAEPQYRRALREPFSIETSAPTDLASG